MSRLSIVPVPRRVRQPSFSCRRNSANMTFNRSRASKGEATKTEAVLSPNSRTFNRSRASKGTVKQGASVGIAVLSIVPVPRRVRQQRLRLIPLARFTPFNRSRASKGEATPPVALNYSLLFSSFQSFPCLEG